MDIQPTPISPPVRATASNPPAAAPTAAAHSVDSFQASPSPLDTVPKEWVPMGHSERQFKAKVGFLTVASGKAEVDRSDTQAAISTSQGNFSFKTDPKKPAELVANTPLGTFEGEATRNGNLINFKADDGQHGVGVKRNDDGSLVVETHGFGVYDNGHLEISAK